MIKVGLISFSDGRKRVHDSLAGYIGECAATLKAELEKTGEVEIFQAAEIIYNTDLAKSQAQLINHWEADAVILNIPVFAFPNLTAIAVSLLQVPCLAIAPVNGKLPGLGGLQAAVNMVKQVGLRCEKVWGNIAEAETLNRVMVFLRAGFAANRLKGQVYGLFGGRSIGMGSGSVNPDQWFQRFGVDVEHIDQLEIIRRAEIVPGEKVDRALRWLTERMGGIQYDQNKLTVDSLKMQIRCYYATRELAAERHLDFIGVKCHYELSEYYVTQCLAAALFNDPYDWDGPKDPLVYSCEADSDGALTMQIMKLISGKPVLFFDFRHYDRTENLFAFCNCGAMATWYANRSVDPAENLQAVKLPPIIDKYAGKGCHVQYIAKEGPMTFGRLTRVLDRYKLTVFRGMMKQVPSSKLEETCPVWPHGFVEVAMDPLSLIQRYDNNHIHGVAGEHVAALIKFCELKGIDYEVIE